MIMVMSMGDVIGLPVCVVEQKPRTEAAKRYRPRLFRIPNRAQCTAHAPYRPCTAHPVTVEHMLNVHKDTDELPDELAKNSHGTDSACG